MKRQKTSHAEKEDSQEEEFQKIEKPLEKPLHYTGLKWQLSKTLEVVRTGEYKMSSHTVVFDVDDTLCCLVKYNIKAKLEDGSCVINYESDNTTYQHVFYPHYNVVLLSLINWGWNVSFFSARPLERKERVEYIISSYIKQSLALFSEDAESDYQAFIKAGQFRIFTRGDLTYYEHLPKEEYEAYGEYKKDLRTCIAKDQEGKETQDIRDIIIIDDDLCYVLRSQYPFIGLSYTASSNYKSYLSSPNPEYRKKELQEYNPINNAYYLFGALLRCKKLLEDGKTTFLRDALDMVCLKPKDFEPTEQYKHFCGRGAPDSDWFLRPESNLYQKEWIEEGKAAIVELSGEHVE